MIEASQANTPSPNWIAFAVVPSTSAASTENELAFAPVLNTDQQDQFQYQGAQMFWLSRFREHVRLTQGVIEDAIPHRLHAHKTSINQLVAYWKYICDYAQDVEEFKEPFANDGDTAHSASSAVAATATTTAGANQSTSTPSSNGGSAGYDALIQNVISQTIVLHRQVKRDLESKCANRTTATITNTGSSVSLNLRECLQRIMDQFVDQEEQYCLQAYSGHEVDKWEELEFWVRDHAIGLQTVDALLEHVFSTHASGIGVCSRSLPNSVHVALHQHQNLTSEFLSLERDLQSTSTAHLDVNYSFFSRMRANAHRYIVALSELIRNLPSMLAIFDVSDCANDDAHDIATDDGSMAEASVQGVEELRISMTRRQLLMDLLKHNMVEAKFAMLRLDALFSAHCQVSTQSV